MHNGQTTDESPATVESAVTGQNVATGENTTTDERAAASGNVATGKSTSTGVRSILVTGAGSGIGLATVLALAQKPDTCVLAGVRKREDVARLRDLDAALHPIWLDVTEPEAIAAAVEAVSERVGKLDALVNNAGFTLACPLEFAPVAEFRRQFEVNVFGQLAVTQAFIPSLRESRGRIVNITSLSGYVSGPFVGPYAASKHAFASLSESLRLELRRQGIRVIQVIPGDIKTPIWEKSRAAADTLRDRLAEQLAVRLPEDVRKAYAEDLQAMRSATSKFAEQAIPVQRVVLAIQHAIFNRKPRSHYIVGARAWGAVRILRLLPTFIRDRIILGNLGMKS